MKALKLRLAVLGTLGLASAQVLATGFENLPATGVAVGSDTSAYILCNTTGNFGSGNPVKPTTGANNTCAVFPSTETGVPDSSYTGLSAFAIASATRDIIMNNSYTGNTDINVGTLRELVWRKSLGGGAYECIYGTKVTLNSNDYNTLVSGRQNFEINDIIIIGDRPRFNFDTLY